MYKKGDIIGSRYEVYGMLGKGGFGIVYLVYDREAKEVAALKTFRDELLADGKAREAFKKEAMLWVNLEEHPFILAARWVQEVSGRLFIQTDYVAPDDRGLVNLLDHLLHSLKPIETDKGLEWAIQFCYGMEHATAHGIKTHRDIKPSNILIMQDETVKITDFGLAAAAEVVWKGGRSLVSGTEDGGLGYSLLATEGRWVCGTPGYVAPEVYLGRGADICSDIYSFGIVLWQMATGSPTPPFNPPYNDDLQKYLKDVYELQISGRMPPTDSSMRPIIERCLNAEPSQRYSNFRELRAQLQSVFHRSTGKSVEVPPTGKATAKFWNDKGGSLHYLRRNEEAIRCFNKALEIDPQYGPAWANKGVSFAHLGRYEDAVHCYDMALRFNPQFTIAWVGKGNNFLHLGQVEAGIRCFDKALEINPREVVAWDNKGNALGILRQYEEAISSHDQALEIDPQFAAAWSNKGNMFNRLGQFEEAIDCYDKALEIDPLNAIFWNNKGASLRSSGRYEEAIRSFDRALDIDPLNGGAWNNKGNALYLLCRHAEAIQCFNEALKIDPSVSLRWFNKARTEESAGRRQDAVKSYKKCIQLASPESEKLTALARQRLQELAG